MTDAVTRIASYNIRKARGLDQKRKPERTLEVINQLDADIVLLQEADRRMGARKPALPRRMIEQETDFHLVDVCTNGISTGWHGNAVLVRDPTWVQSVERLTLPGLEPRGALRLELNLAGRVSVVAVHLGLRRKDRRAQLAALCAATRGVGPVVMAGDFNEWSPQRGFEPLADRFTTHTPGMTFHARHPVAALDRFALSAGVDMRDAGVAQGRLAKRASDHLPIWSDIALLSASTC